MPSTVFFRVFKLESASLISLISSFMTSHLDIANLDAISGT